MENSMNSMNKPMISEESGWTTYFEDFFSKKANHGVDDCSHDEEEEHSFCISSDFNFHESSSMVSDAASSAAAGKLDGAGDQQKRLSFKRRRKIKGANYVDYDLEDTASSPANSPKVCNLLDHNKDTINQDGTMNPSQARQEKLIIKNGTSRSGEMNHEIQLRERDDDNTDNDTNLKKRGLCLVPLSMVVSFLG